MINWGRRTCESPSHQRNHESKNFGERQDRTKEFQESSEPVGGKGSDMVQRANTSTGNKFRLSHDCGFYSAHMYNLYVQTFIEEVTRKHHSPRSQSFLRVGFVSPARAKGSSKQYALDPRSWVLINNIHRPTNSTRPSMILLHLLDQRAQMRGESTHPKT